MWPGMAEAEGTSQAGMVDQAVQRVCEGAEDACSGLAACASQGRSRRNRPATGPLAGERAYARRSSVSWWSAVIAL
jgi:hypothetical protein